MATATEGFSQLVGNIVHNCGVLEYLTIRSIETLETDPKRADKMLERQFRGRIDELRRLLNAKTTLPPDRVNSLCDQLSIVATERNKVAHNPVASDDKHGTNPRIIVVRRVSDLANGEVLTENDLRRLRELTRDTLRTFQRLALDAGIVKPETFDNQDNC